MARPQVQGNDGAVFLIAVCDGCGDVYPGHSSEVCACLDREGARHLTEIAVVPLADAEKLATALEEIRDACEPDDPISTTAAFALGLWRAAHPREETWQAEEIEAARERAEQTAEMLDWREETTG